MTSLNEQLFHAKSQTEKLIPMLSLRGAYAQKDVNNKSGKPHCFVIISEADKRTFYMAGDTEEEAIEWVEMLQKRINDISFA